MTVGRLAREFALEWAIKGTTICSCNRGTRRSQANQHERHPPSKSEELIIGLNGRILSAVIPENVTGVTADRDRTFLQSLCRWN
jgi:hypothetical protein